ncbi:MAG: M64 family metallopeptidase [Fidelibacterota bacterium]
MGKRFLFIILVMVMNQTFAIDFDAFFENRTMRIDYFHIGDKTTDEVVLDLIYKEEEWAGNPNSLFDNFNNGKYYYKIYDVNSNTLIYSRGFNNYFHEYQTTVPAGKGIKRAYHESAHIPYPKNKILFVIEKRDRYNTLAPVFQQIIDPDDYHIITENRGNSEDYIYAANVVGQPHECVDIAIIGEGYTDKEKRKFKKDVDRYVEELFSIEPFKSNRAKINIRGVLRYSRESGVDEPTKNIYKNTILDATFNSFDSPRYLLTENNKMLQNIAAQVPSDALIILANIDRYGGGGIYNFYAISTANESKWNDFVFIHEFAHSFAGLADEYYSSSVAYDDFYPEGIEPTEPNITRLLDPEHLKWKDLMDEGLKIPTDWGKIQYDSMTVRVGELNRDRNKAIADMKAANKTEEEIKKCREKYKKEIEDTRQRLKDFMIDHPLRGKVGVFEGAGYSSKGIYRPTLNSIMHQFTDQDKVFYPVNERAIQAVIDYYTK